MKKIIAQCGTLFVVLAVTAPQAFGVVVVDSEPTALPFSDVSLIGVLAAAAVGVAWLVRRNRK